MNDRLIVRGAREHNLKNVSLDMPRNSLIVFVYYKLKLANNINDN